MRLTGLKQEDTKFQAVDGTPRGYESYPYKCDECGKIPQDQQFIAVQWAVGSTGFVGITCCGHLFEQEATVSDDGMAMGHWYQNSSL
jgi:hypothetical protein